MSRVVKALIAGSLLFARPLRAQSGGTQVTFEPGFAHLHTFNESDVLFSSTAFNFRFVARFPLASRVDWLLGLDLFAFGDSGPGGRRNNAPAPFSGAAVRVAGGEKSTDWYRLEIPVLARYVIREDTTVASNGPYRPELALQMRGDVFLGRRWFPQLGARWRTVRLYALASQRVAGGGTTFDPVLMYGATILLGRLDSTR